MAPIKNAFFGGYNKKQTDEEIARLKQEHEAEISELKKLLEEKEGENRELKQRNDELVEEGRYIPQALVFVKDKADSIIREAKEEYEKNLAAYNAEKDFLEARISGMRAYLAQALSEAEKAASRMSSELNLLYSHKFDNMLLSPASNGWDNADGDIESKLEVAKTAAELIAREDSPEDILGDVMAGSDNAEAHGGPAPAGVADDAPNEAAYADADITPSDKEYLQSLIDELIDD